VAGGEVRGPVRERTMPVHESVVEVPEYEALHMAHSNDP
jgi:hypothetical protein